MMVVVVVVKEEAAAVAAVASGGGGSKGLGSERQKYADRAVVREGLSKGYREACKYCAAGTPVAAVIAGGACIGGRLSQLARGYLTK